MNEAIYTLEGEHPGVRYVAYYDHDVENPLEMLGSDEVQAVHTDRSNIVSSVSGTMRVFLTVLYENNEELALKVARRHAAVFEPDTKIAYSAARGLVVVVSDPGYGTPEGWLDEYGQWADGNVYGVAAEEWDEDLEDWLETDSLWGIYADDEEEAAKYYREYCAGT